MDMMSINYAIVAFQSVAIQFLRWMPDMFRYVKPSVVHRIEFFSHAPSVCSFQRAVISYLATWGHHYSDVIMGTMASQITSLTIVYSTDYSNICQRKHQSSASLAFVRGIHWWAVNSPHKGPVTRKMLPFDDVIMIMALSNLAGANGVSAGSSLAVRTGYIESCHRTNTLYTLAHYGSICAGALLLQWSVKQTANFG